jgi:hypothetical protein
MRNTSLTVPRPHLGDSRAVLDDRRTAAGALVVVALAAVLSLLAVDARLGYDTAYQLVWGRELLDGGLPEYDVRLAPTPHPLQVLVAAPLSLLGQGTDEAMRALSVLSLVLLAAALYRIGTLLFCRPVGALAAAVLVTRPHLIEMAYLGDADIPAVALAACRRAGRDGTDPRPRGARARPARAGRAPAPGGVAAVGGLPRLAGPRT